MKIKSLLGVILALVLISCNINPEISKTPTKTLLAVFTSTSTITPTNTATATLTSTPIPTPTSFGGGTGTLIFEYYRDGFHKLFPDLRGSLNVFTSDVTGTNLIPITDGVNGYNVIQSISPDQSKILVTSFKTDPATAMGRVKRSWDLYLYSLTDQTGEPLKLASGLSSPLNKIADWIDNSNIVYISQDTQGSGIYVTKTDGTDQKNILKKENGATPVSIVTISDGRIYWGSETSIPHSTGGWAFWWSNIDGSEQAPLSLNGSQVKCFCQFSVSPDHTTVAWIEHAGYQNDILRVAKFSAMDQAQNVGLPKIDNPEKLSYVDSYHWTFANIAWWSDSSKFLIIAGGKNYGKIYGKTNYTDPYTFTVVQIKDFVVTELKIPQLTPFNSLTSMPSYARKNTFSISPDGSQMLISKPVGKVLERETLILDLVKMEYSDIFSNAINPSSNIDEPTWKIYWLP